MNSEDEKRINEYAKNLRSLLEQARFANNDELRRTVSEDLVQFIIKSTPPDPLDDEQRKTIEYLDEIAQNTSHALLIKNIEDSVSTIIDESINLARITKEFQIAAEKNREQAKKIRLTHLRQTVDTANLLVKALLKTDTELLEDDEKSDETSIKITDAINAIQSARNAIEVLTLLPL